MSQEPNNTGEPGTAGVSSSKENAKVELDLDDAPFLQEDEPEPEPKPKDAPRKPDKEVSSSGSAPADETKDPGKKKKIIIAGAAAGFLAVIGIVLWLLVFSGDPDPVPAPGPEPEKVLATPQTAPPAPMPQFTLQWEPFWVELKDTEGAIRFLTLKFSTPMDNPILFAEMNAKMLILRDALFYYLRNQPILSLSDEAKVQMFKSDLLTVINEHLGSGKASEILIQDYLVQ